MRDGKAVAGARQDREHSLIQRDGRILKKAFAYGALPPNSTSPIQRHSGSPIVILRISQEKRHRLPLVPLAKRSHRILIPSR
jgi:hypothetical protein